MKPRSEQTDYLLELRKRYSEKPSADQPEPSYDEFVSFINKLLINHTSWCDVGCATCGKGKQFDMETIKRMTTFLGSYPVECDGQLGEHILHVELDEQCLVCRFSDGQLGDSIDMYKQTKKTNVLYGKYDISI